ncbi:MAG: type I restriction endonuclease subunit R [Mycoplasmoidaceae bacterium]
MTKNYDILLSKEEGTVVFEYDSEKRKRKTYQSEKDLEDEFINNLKRQGYEFLNINQEKELKINLRNQIEKLNNFKFNEDEWNRFFTNELVNKNFSLVDKTNRIQNDEIINFNTDDNKTINIKILDKKNPQNNILQVINQYETDSGTYKNRYDVTILVNGLPLIHVELKKRGVNLKEAFNQIERYKRESFWADSGLFEYVQLYVISNGTETKYYTNTIREDSIDKKIHNKSKKNNTNDTNTFEFTSYWADSKNNPIKDLIDFTKTFFSRHTILNVLTKYCVFTVDKKLLVMRPYQIVGTERIINKVKSTYLNKIWGKENSGGYIWHTTGSGKTLTSFKTAQLLRNDKEIEKILFVVDRQDLDYQTIKEYNNYEKDCVSSNKSSRELANKLKSTSIQDKLIVTTIQKLNNLVKSEKSNEIYSKKTVIIFDECHRSQFGAMHVEIRKRFKMYSIFGFTGTPIFVESNSKENGLIRTTEQVFGTKLHTYNIQDAIRDGNVLPFRIDFYKTMNIKSEINDKKVWSIDEEKAYNDPKRIELISNYIMDNFDIKTKRDSTSNININRKKGFNSIFATSSINAAKLYYLKLKEINDSRDKKINIALIYSFSQNEDLSNGDFDDEDFNNEKLDKSSREFLDEAIQDYNKLFGDSFDTSSEKFQSYYKDISKRMKERELDLLIVVNMFLTGFDAKCLNTLWVDKNLRMHGLMQAFSRTNRILNSVKTFGYICCFRDLEEEVDETMKLYGDKDASGVVFLKSFDYYYKGYEDENGEFQKGYEGLVEELKTKFPLPMGLLGSESLKKEFINLFNKILKLENILNSFDDFKNMKLITEAEGQDYRSEYHTIREDILKLKEENTKENINDDIEFEMELIKQIEVNIDYILELITNSSDINFKDFNEKINRIVDSSTLLRNKKDLIDEFINSFRENIVKKDGWKEFFDSKRNKELLKLIEDYKLNYDETMKLSEDIYERGEIKYSEIDRIMPPKSRFNPEKGNEKEVIKNKIKKYFERHIERFTTN